ncbi:putative disease resistance RPP13-like protein 1 [Vigna unguiculata]|uniref:putative disease resistance RPP13-like protein 1 n=1 Tax=Vigna unguiculata TaxID=3917 RepID=UPI0010169E54|nr:putative disease resistance RPP13-like protein 1 [Vigna unguiculata]
MAAALVGGALLSAFLQVAFDRLASPNVVDFFRGRKLDEKLLGNLNIMLHSINALAHDAEQKQFTDPHVKAWLFAVKEAVFDAEDLLNEIDYELTRCQVEAGSDPQTLASKVSNFFNSTFSSFNKKIESEIREVLEKLEYLAKQKGALGLKEGIYSGDSSGSKEPQKLPSSSLVVESVIYGRDADKEMILNWLTSETENHDQPSILSIVGMGGLGKTTLAQHVYNDPKIDEAKFDIRAWVCVSDHFDVLIVTKTILEAITKSKDDSGDLEMVHGRLKKKISRRKFLLVLDDVWNERREEWEAVRTPLSYGAPGSKILVTTRGEKVASNMMSEVHRLKQLEEEECWKLFKKHALKNDDHELNDEKKKIGRRIVEKCKGLPLALKTIGSLLRTKSSISDWQSVLESDIWDLPKEVEIMPALLLSYQHLPSHLKRCFAYCALFPKDYEFDKKELILLWMAEDFLHHSNKIKSAQEIGEQYFDDLLTRSFFLQLSSEMRQIKKVREIGEQYFHDQLTRSFFLESSFEMRFVMHDLLNDLAKYVCADFCFRLKFDKGSCIPNTTRHFSFSFGDVEYFDGLGNLTDAKRLRSFHSITNNCSYKFNPCQFNILVHELFSKFKFLHVLSLNGYAQLIEVPNSVGDLKHLCSIDLSYTHIQKLPDSICLLYNLLIMKMNFCSFLEELPSNLHKLTKLNCLEFEHTNVRKMPMHFGELKNIQVLSTFSVDRDSKVINIKQLGGLNLHGRLSINEVQNIVNPLDALEANLKNQHLVELKLKWTLNHMPDDPKKERKVLENLQPPKHLEHLSIENYGGTKFPSWVFDNSLSNLVFLHLENCKYCLWLPPFGLLSSLKSLEITGLDGIVSIGAEFYGSDSSSFRSLETLKFYNMKELEEWECKTTSFPRLQNLHIYHCRKLKCLPNQLLHLKNLDISCCDKLVISVNKMFTSSLQLLSVMLCPLVNMPRTNYDFLEAMEINSNCVYFTIFPLDFFPNLRLLQLSWCQNLKAVSQEHAHNHLKVLRIGDCPQFESFPSEGLSAPRLQIISIRGAESLKLMPKRMQFLLPSLTDLVIIDCPKVEMFPDEGLPSNLKKMSLSSLKLIASLRDTLDANTCLESLIVEKLDVESFPGEVLLPRSLTTLHIRFCPNLKKLDYNGLSHISSVIYYGCPNLHQRKLQSS